MITYMPTALRFLVMTTSPTCLSTSESESYPCIYANRTEKKTSTLTDYLKKELAILKK